MGSIRDRIHSLLINNVPPGETDRHFFKSKIECVALFSTLMKSVCISESINVFIHEGGIKFTVEDSKCSQLSLFIRRPFFGDFELQTPSQTNAFNFKMQTKEFLDYLRAFVSDGRGGGDTLGNDTQNENLTLWLGCKFPELSFFVIMEEYSCFSEIEVKTEQVDDLLDFELDDLRCRIIMIAEPLKECLARMEGTNESIMELIVLPGQKAIFAVDDGSGGTVELLIPETSEAVEVFECSEPCQVRFNLSMLRNCFRALYLSHKVALKIDQNSVLNFTFMAQNKTDCFIEFYCLPMVEETGDDLDMSVER